MDSKLLPSVCNRCIGVQNVRALTSVAEIVPIYCLNGVDAITQRIECEFFPIRQNCRVRVNHIRDSSAAPHSGEVVTFHCLDTVVNGRGSIT